MPLISQSIPTLLRGVSQASEAQKQSDHALAQENFLSSPAEGLKRRSGTQYIATLQSSAMGNVHIHTINRDQNENYIAVFGNKSIKVFDAKDGSEKNIVFNNTSTDDFNYLIRDALPNQTTLNNNTNFIAGTYSQSDVTGDASGTIITITSNGHGLKTGDVAGCDFTSGHAVDGDFTVTVTSANTFTCTAASSDSTSGVVYFSTSSPKEEFKTVSVADYTFVLNTNKKVAMTTDLSPGVNNGALIFFNQVSDKTYYTITINNTIAVYDTSNDNTLSTTTVATGIKDKLLASPDSGSALTGFTIIQNGPVLWIKKDDNTDFGIDTNDTQGNSQITLVKKSIQNFTDLPVVAPNNFVVEVKGSDSTKFDNHYVKFVTNNGGSFEQGQWEETVKPGISYKFDYETMPYVLVRKRNGDFLFSQADGGQYSIIDKTVTYSLANQVVTVTSTAHGLSTGNQVEVKILSGNALPLSAIKTITVTDANTFTYPVDTGGFSTNMSLAYGLANTETLPKWGERTVGDLDTAPNPSFVGQRLNNIFFFRNRLGILSDDDVILSRVGEYFNFFPETVTTVIDSDPIDVAASNTKVSILKHAITMGEQLILFSENTQFVLSASDDSLTPKTANILVSTAFESNTKPNPISVGSSIYFMTKKGVYSGVREYITQPGINIKDASDITIHIPRYIPGDILKLTALDTKNILVLLPDSTGITTPNSSEKNLYINRWLYGEDSKKVLNSWSEISIGNALTKILHIDFIDTDLHLVIEESNQTLLVRLPFEDNFSTEHASGEIIQLPVEAHLDDKINESTTGFSFAYSSTTKLSTFTFPYKLRETPTIIGRYCKQKTDLAKSHSVAYPTETSTYVDIKGDTKDLQPFQHILTSKVATADAGTTQTVTAEGDYRNSKLLMGYSFLSSYVFSQQKIIDKTTNAPVLSSRVQMRYFYLKYENTGSFGIEVMPEGNIYSYKFNFNKLGTTSADSFLGSRIVKLNNIGKFENDVDPIVNTTAIPCVAVIDETSPSQTIINNSWESFRNKWPDRPFFILVPVGEGNSTAAVKHPTIEPQDYTKTAVNRDNGSTNNVSDWFTLTGMSQYGAGTEITLWVDVSGSMTLSTVQASYNKFLADCATANINVTITTEANTNEDYVYPFIDNEIGGGGGTTDPNPIWKGDIAGVFSTPLESGVYKFPVMSKADRVSILVHTDSVFSAGFVSAEYEAMYHSRSRKI